MFTVVNIVHFHDFINYFTIIWKMPLAVLDCLYFTPSFASCMVTHHGSSASTQQLVTQSYIYSGFAAFGELHTTGLHCRFLDQLWC